MTTVVVINPVYKFYKRYEGKTCTHKAQADSLLTAGEVESFRVSPDDSIVEDDDGKSA